VSDHLDRQWCCFTCNTRFPMGRMRPHPTIYALRCPNCDGMDTHPAHGETIVLDEYLGEPGTLQ